MTRLTTWLAAALVALLAGCASGPRYADVAPNIPPPAADQGRIVFFRSSTLGAAVQPDLRLNGQTVGTFAPRGVFFVDRPLGRYTAQARTEVETTLDIDVVPQQTRYVEMSIAMGFLVGQPRLALRTPLEALPELTDLAYTGRQAFAQAAVPATGAGALAAAPADAAALPLPSPPASPPASAAPSLPPAPSAPLAQADPAPPAAAASADGGRASPRLVRYRLNDRMGGPARDVSFRFFEADGERMSFNNGTWIETADGTFVESTSQIAGDFDTVVPPGGWVRPRTLAAGDSWTARYERKVGAGQVKMDLTAVVIGPDTVVVAGQAMPVVLVEYRGYTTRIGNSVASSQNQTAKYEARAWYAPQLHRVVRFAAKTRGGIGGGAFVVDEELNLAAIR